MRRWISVAAMAVAVSGCGVTGPAATFDESEAGARDTARVVAEAIGDADRLERITVGPLSCGGSNRYADMSSYLPIGREPSDADLDTIDAGLVELGYREDSREEFAVGPFRLWAGPDDRTVSVSVVTDEQAVRIKTRGVCARPPG